MLDKLSYTILIVCTIFTLTTLYYLGRTILELIRKQRRFVHNGWKSVAGMFVSLLLMGNIGYCIYNAPVILFRVSSWYAIEIMGPYSLIITALSLAVIVPLFYIYALLNIFFVKENDKPFFLIISMSIANGIGSSLVVFIINTALVRDDRLESGLYIFFVLGVLLDVVSTYVTRKNMLIFTNNMIYEKRVDMINKILNAPFQNIENIGKEKIFAGLNNDTETVSGFVNVLVSGVSSIIIVICCLTYISFLDFKGFIFAMISILIGCSIFLGIRDSARKLFEETRETQTVFFKFINDMMWGIKEIYLNYNRGMDFTADMKESCDTYRKTRIQGEFRFIAVTISSSILINCVIGLTAFLFPTIFNGVDTNMLREYVVVYLYMVSPIMLINNMLPNLTRVRVSWNRINELINTFSSMERKVSSVNVRIPKNNVLIKLEEILYQYKNKDGENFGIGPINYEFKSGEIVFITGGNGSGKSTLAKLVTGLYTPDSGKILINGRKFDYEEHGKNYFSAIFSDCYLFDKLYGIDLSQNANKAQKHLERLYIADKVQIKDGAFTTTKLSTGQKKRMALVVSYLEDRPVYIFDEWAADQDPEFRKEFYEVLLPELRDKGKCVIAISHDDRYFYLADKIIRMEVGKMVESQEFCMV